MISDNVKELIEFYSTEINGNLWEALYDVLYHMESLSFQYIGEFTECMLKAGINPLTYLDYVPECYLCHTNVEKVVHDNDSIATIKSWAYSNCTHIKYVFLGENISTVEENAFAYGGTIRELAIMNPETDIDTFAFYDTDVEKVIYHGTKEQWEQTQNDYIHANHVECTDGVYR